MAIRIDSALNLLPRQIRRQLDDEVGSGRSGPIAAAVMPLNAVLLDRQQRIDGLVQAVERLTRERDALEPDAKRYQAFRAAIVNDDDHFIDRAADLIPNEDVPITDAMVDDGFDAAIAAQGAKP